MMHGLFASLLLALAPALRGDHEGTWRGTLELDGRELELVGWFEPRTEALTARLHIPALGAMNLVFSEQLDQRDALVLASPLPGGSLSLRGEFDEAGALRGTWSWTNRGGSFVALLLHSWEPTRAVRAGI